MHPFNQTCVLIFPDDQLQSPSVSCFIICLSVASVSADQRENIEPDPGNHYQGQDDGHHTHKQGISFLSSIGHCDLLLRSAYQILHFSCSACWILHFLCLINRALRFLFAAHWTLHFLYSINRALCFLYAVHWTLRSPSPLSIRANLAIASATASFSGSLRLKSCSG